MIMEVRTKVEPVKVELHCDDCGCEMKRTRTGMTAPPVHVYMCDGCFKTYDSRKQYPYIDYVSIETTQERKRLDK